MKPGAAFGWEVTAEFCDRIVFIPGSDLNWVKVFHYRGSRSQAIIRVKLKSNFQRIVGVEPVTEEQWLRTYGEGRM